MNCVVIYSTEKESKVSSNDIFKSQTLNLCIEWLFEFTIEEAK